MLLLKAVGSRILILFLGIFFDFLIEDFKTDAFQLDLEKSNTPSFFLPFLKWDSAHFFEIYLNYLKKKDYKNLSLEKYAFFPGMPKFFSLLCFFEDENYQILFGLFLNQVFFVLSCFEFRKLARKIFNNKMQLDLVLNFYIFNPSSIFFSSFYSESLYNFVSFSFFNFFLQKNQIFIIIIFLIFGSSIRFFGIFNFFIFFNNFSLKKMFLVIFAFLPSIVIFSKAYFDKCPGEEFCDFFFPNVYTHVQSKFWQVGFLKFWRLKQIPNFLIASPFFYLVFTKLKFYSLSLSLPRARARARARAGFQFPTFPTFPTFPFDRDRLTVTHQQLSLRFLFDLHWIFLSLVTLFFGNVQIINRISCTCPGFFFSLANLGSLQSTYKSIFFVYLILGTAGHVNSLPFV